MLKPSLVTAAVLHGLAVLGAGYVRSARAATLTVDSPTDDSSGCTLREAVISANENDAEGNGCASGDPGVDTIVFDATLSNEIITLGGNAISVTEDVIIEGGAAPGLAISGGGGRIVFQGTSASLTLRDLTIRDGYTDLADGAVTVNGGSLHVERVAFLDNASYSGAAITILGATSASIVNSTIANNTAAQLPGAVYVANATVSIINSTFTGNAVQYGGPTDLFANPGNASATIENSVLTGTCLGAITSSSSYFQDSSCGMPTGDPMLDSTLRTMGSPTPFFGLQVGSPLRDSGNQTICDGLATDQRGAPRSRDGDGMGGAVCDIGAIEVGDENAVPVELERFRVD